MPRPTVLRALLAALVAVAAWSGAARAQAPCGCASAPDGQSARSQHPILNKLRPCWTHFNSDYTCYSWLAEAQFIFGDCKSFFGEPCWRGGPPANGPCTNGCFVPK
jgi:hypothetical protein